ncbi:MAG: hypothetical protein ACPLKS_04780 [Caldisericum exile]|uniref:hypothetical protein n=1 Tax=Caldisericum exile TaxID=693075 RepID=UPI003C760090
MRPRIRNGQETSDTKVLRVYVSKKLPEAQLELKHVVPKCLFLSNEFFETDIVDFGGIPKALSEDPTRKFRPVKAGISACHINCTACTITGFFRDKQTGQVYIGLNNHCGALENKAKAGDVWIQPSPYDDGTVKDEFARLHHFVEIKFSEFKCPYRNFFHRIYRFAKRDIPLNKVDISFGVPSVDYELSALNVPNAFNGYREPEINELCQKNGRTTGLKTNGKVVSTNWTGQVRYSRGIAMFTDCILIEGQGFSAGGDSGSPIFDMNGSLIGVLFAGSDRYTIACKLKNVEQEGNVTVVARNEI